MHARGLIAPMLVAAVLVASMPAPAADSGPIKDAAPAAAGDRASRPVVAIYY